MVTWVKDCKSDSEGVRQLREYLYNGNANDELVQIYEQIDSDVVELEEELIDNDEQINFEMRDDIKKLIKNFRSLKRDDILQELKRIYF